MSGQKNTQVTSYRITAIFSGERCIYDVTPEPHPAHRDRVESAKVGLKEALRNYFPVNSKLTLEFSVPGRGN